MPRPAGPRRSRALGAGDRRRRRRPICGGDSVGGAHGIRLIGPPSWSTAIRSRGWPPAAAAPWSWRGQRDAAPPCGDVGAEQDHPADLAAADPAEQVGARRRCRPSGRSASGRSAGRRSRPASPPTRPGRRRGRSARATTAAASGRATRGRRRRRRRAGHRSPGGDDHVSVPTAASRCSPAGPAPLQGGTVASVGESGVATIRRPPPRSNATVTGGTRSPRSRWRRRTIVCQPSPGCERQIVAAGRAGAVRPGPSRCRRRAAGSWPSGIGAGVGTGVRHRRRRDPVARGAFPARDPAASGRRGGTGPDGGRGVAVGVGAGVAGVGDSVGDGDSTGDGDSAGEADGSGDGDSAPRRRWRSATDRSDARGRPAAEPAHRQHERRGHQAGADEARQGRTPGDPGGGARSGPAGRPVTATTPRRSDRSWSWAPSRGLQLRSGAADGRAEGSGRRPEDAAGFVVGRALDGGHHERRSFERREVGHRGPDVEPAGLEPSGRPSRRCRPACRSTSRRRSRPEPVRREAAGRHEEPRQDRPSQSSRSRWSHSRRNASWARSSAAPQSFVQARAKRKTSDQCASKARS